MDDEVAEPSGTPPAGVESLSESELGKAKADNLRLKQEVARWKDANAKAAPVLMAVRNLAESGEEGRGIVRKLLSGEPLTASQEKKAERAAEEFLTAKDLERFLGGDFTEKIASMIEERLYVTDSAKEGRKQLDEWASKEYGETYDGLKGSTAFKRKLLKNHEELAGGVQEGLYEIPSKYKGDEVERVFKWAIDQTMAQVKADNPQLGKKVKVEKSDEEKRSEKLSVSTRSSGSSGDVNEIPEDLREEVASIRRLGTRTTVGRSFSRRQSSART